VIDSTSITVCQCKVPYKRSEERENGDEGTFDVEESEKGSGQK
jgi:hypothetical protein